MLMEMESSICWTSARLFNLLSSGKFIKEADIDGDGFVNLLDVAGFVQILSGGGS